MATIADLIDEAIAVTVGDPDNERRLDAAYLTFFKNAFRHVNSLIPVHGFTFAEKVKVFNTVASTTEYALADAPLSITDYNGAIALFRNDEDVPIEGPRSLAEWYSISTPGHLWGWRMDENGKNLWVKAVDSIEAMTFAYYSKVDVANLATDTTSPFNGDLDGYIIDAVAARVNSIEEMVALPQDVKFWSDFERGLIARFSSPAPWGNFVASCYRVGRNA